MTFQPADWVIPLFFLAALVLMVKFRRQIQSEDKESYKYISAGLVLLALASVSRIYFMDGLFAHVPFLSDALFYRITSWIVIITGTTFVVSGLATWLPIARRMRRTADVRISRLEFLKNVERLAALESRPETMFRGALEYMMEHYGFRQGIVYRYSTARSLLLLTGCAPRDQFDGNLLPAVTLESSEVSRFCDGSTRLAERLFASVADPSGAPTLVLPVMVDSRPAGFFLLWGKEQAVEIDDDRINLKIAVDILARKISGERLRLQANHYTRRANLQHELEIIQASDQSSFEKITSALRHVRLMVDAQVASLWIVRPNADFFTRFTIGEAGSLLHEKGLPVPERYQDLRDCLCTKRPTMIRRDEGTDTELLSSTVGREYERAVVIPISISSVMETVLIVGARNGQSLTTSEAQLLCSQSPSFARLVAALAESMSENPTDRRLAAADRLMRVFKRTGDIDALMQNTADLLAGNPPSAMVRIVTAEGDGLYATSRGLAFNSHSEPMTPERGMMIRALMPCLQTVLATGRMIVASADSRESSLTLAESNQLFDEHVTSIAIVPISTRHGVVGGVCLGISDSDRSSQLTRQSLLLARTVAHELGFALELTEHPDLSNEGLYRTEYYPQSLREDLDLRSRVKSSLSGIFGSVELLKAQQEVSDPQMDRYLTIIDRSARRITEYLDPQEELMISK